MGLNLLFALTNWHRLNKALSDFTEQEIDAMINHELTTKRRRTILKRLHERRCVLRTKREWVEMLEDLIGVVKC